MNGHQSRWARAWRAGLVAALAVPTLVVGVIAPPGSPVVADTDAPFELNPVKAVAPASSEAAPLRPGDAVTYTIGYSCSGLAQGATCEGATVTDVLPTFVDVNGDIAQLAFDDETSDGWSFGGVSTNGDGLLQVTWTAGSAIGGGTSGAFTLVLRVPPGTVGVTPEPQQFTNTAVGAFEGHTTEALSPVSYLNALAPSSQISKSGPSSALLNAAGTNDISHTISICPSAGTALWPSYTVVDTLPLGATLVTDPLPFGGTFAADPDAEPATGGTITWQLTPASRPAPDAQGCIRMTFQVRYVNAAAGGHPTNEVTATKTNRVSATGFDADPGTGQAIGPAQTTLTLTGPVTRFSPSKNTGGNFYVADGETVEYRLGASNTSDAEAAPFSTATLTDGPLPVEFTLNEIRTGSWTGSSTGDVIALIETSPDGSTWTQVSTAPNTTITTGLTGVRYVRWTFTSPGAPAIGPGWSTSTNSLRLIGTMSGAPDPSENLVNCAALTGVQSGVQQNRGQSCATVQLEVPQPHPSIAKTVSAASPSGRPSGQFEPGDTVTYTLSIGNNGDATGPLVDPRVVDCVPNAQYLEVSNIVLGAGWAGGATPNTECDPGTTQLVFTYSGSVNPGASAPTISYDVTAQDFAPGEPPQPPTPPGTYTNTATVTQSDGSAFGHCVQSNCRAIRTITLRPVVRLDSQKLVRGATDSVVNAAGTTTPGGQVTYRLEVQNAGNTQVNAVEFIDIFPYPGDTGVRLFNTPRNSVLSPYLVSPIIPPPDWTVEYSLSDTPCRGGVFGPTNNCDAPQWTTTPNLAALPQYRSIRLTYGQRLDIGESLAFEWQMVTPVNDPEYADGADPYGRLTDCTIPESDPPYPNNLGASTLADRVQSADPDCPKAVNSFAYGASIPNDQLNGLPNPGRIGAEPPAVALYVAAEPQPNVLGDRVWNDLDNDGVQDAGEPGIASVRVELWSVDAGAPSALLATTFTDPDGLYLFENLPAADYVVRFYLPDHLGYVSPETATVGGNPVPLLDSDVPQTPSGTEVTLGNFFDTPVIPLSGVDVSWDAGLWIPDPDVSITKYVSGGEFVDEDANTAPGIRVYPGGAVTPDGPTLPGDLLEFTYEVENTGNTYLVDVDVTDTVTTPSSGVTAPTPVCDWNGSSDADTPAGALSPGETVTCTAAEVPSMLGAYRNVGEVTATATQHPTDPTDLDTYAAIDLPDFVTAVSDDDPANVTGVTHQVGDFLFLDVDADGRYTDGTDVPVPVATEVHLYEGDAAEHVAGVGTPLAITTTSLGRYVFSNLPPDQRYYVVIPPSQFAEGGPLFGLVPAADATTTEAVNEGVDHNAVFVNGTDVSDGVRSAVSSVEFTSTLQGGQWIGNGPTTDGPLDPDAPDLYLGVPAHLSDRTLDLGFVGLPPLELATESVCVNDTPFLRFRVDNNFEPVTPAATVTFRGTDDEGDPTGPTVDVFQVLDPGTPDQELASTPLTSVPLGEWITVLWPEADIDAGFDPIGWPGWEFVDGRWNQIATDVRPQLHLSVSVNPDLDSVLDYPAPVADPPCELDPPVSSIGDRVWWDQDADGDDQEGAEPGIPAATVTITWAGPDGEFGTGDDVTYPALTTDADGYYLLDRLPAGEFRVEVSDVDPALVPTYDVDGTSTPNVSVVMLGENDDRRDADFGFRVEMALGDLVWFDANADGTYTPGVDVPLQNVPVELWAPGGEAPLATTTTDVGGRYLFEGLDPGRYSVRIPAAPFAPDASGALAGWSAAPVGVSDPDDDVDEGDVQLPGDHNAVDGPGGAAIGGVWTNPITLGLTLDAEGNVVSDEPGTGEPGGELTNLTLDLALAAPVAIDVEKSTNGRDADDPRGPFVPAGSTVTWTYVVTNTGLVPLIDVVLIDDVEGPVECEIALLLPGAANAVTCTLTGAALPAPAPAQYANVATVDARPALPYDSEGFIPARIDVDEPAGELWSGDRETYRPITDVDGEPVDRVTDDDPSHHVSARPGIDIEKATNGVDADVGPGPWIETGSTVTWTYVVRNTGNVRLGSVTVTDSRGVVVDCGGGSNVIAVLPVGANRTCTGTGTAVAGTYSNTGLVIGTPLDDAGAPIVDPDMSAPMAKPTDSDPSHYQGADAAVGIDKQVCRLDTAADCDPAVASHWVEHAVLSDGATVVWRIEVTNLGNVTLDPVRITDPVAPACARNLGTLTPGASIEFTCTLAGLSAEVDNVATVAGTPVDSEGDRIVPAPATTPMPPVTATDDASASPPSDLTVDKSVDATTIQVGDTATWTLVVTNTGAGPAEGVRLLDTLPAGLQVVDHDPGMRYDAASNQLSADVGSLAPGQSVTFRYVTLLTAATAETIANVVEVGALGPDGTTDEVFDDDTVAVQPVLPTGPGGLPATGASILAVLVLALAALGAGLVFRSGGARVRKRDVT